jgi:DNA-binding NarL/FixJ family response regulator
VLVLDYSIPGGGAPPLIEDLVRLRCRTRILLLTVHESIHYAVKVLEAGAHGYVIKSAAVKEIVEAIRDVNQNEIYISPKISHRVIDHLRRPKRDRVGLDSLSVREFELLRYLGAGMSLKEAAKRQHISTSTASTYRARLMEKLSLDNTAQLIRYALENDIVG